MFVCVYAQRLSLNIRVSNMTRCVSLRTWFHVVNGASRTCDSSTSVGRHTFWNAKSHTHSVVMQHSHMIVQPNCLILLIEWWETLQATISSLNRFALPQRIISWLASNSTFFIIFHYGLKKIVWIIKKLFVSISMCVWGWWNSVRQSDRFSELTRTDLGNERFDAMTSR